MQFIVSHILSLEISPDIHSAHNLRTLLFFYLQMQMKRNEKLSHDLNEKLSHDCHVIVTHFNISTIEQISYNNLYAKHEFYFQNKSRFTHTIVQVFLSNS